MIYLVNHKQAQMKEIIYSQLGVLINVKHSFYCVIKVNQNICAFCDNLIQNEHQKYIYYAIFNLN